MPCPFCEPRLDASRVTHQSALSLAIDPRHSILRGSRIIVPRRHCSSPFDLSEAELLDGFELLRVVRAEIDAALAPEGYNLGWNIGAVAGQEVEHVHLHCIPRFGDEPLAGKGIRYWLKQDANRRPDASA